MDKAKRKQKKFQILPFVMLWELPNWSSDKHRRSWKRKKNVNSLRLTFLQTVWWCFGF